MPLPHPPLHSASSVPRQLCGSYTRNTACSSNRTTPLPQREGEEGVATIRVAYVDKKAGEESLTPAEKHGGAGEDHGVKPRPTTQKKEVRP